MIFCAWIIFDIYSWSLIFIMNPIDSIFSNAAIAVLVHTFLVHGWLSVDCSVYFIVTCRLLYPMYSPCSPPPETQEEGDDSRRRDVILIDLLTSSPSRVRFPSKLIAGPP